ncbi:MAG: glycoside hydrolase family 97 protein [Bacteroidales bacterium]|nr:glycoside hydrolase family 97 protein [Bacteroidales bacterium]
MRKILVVMLLSLTGILFSCKNSSEKMFTLPSPDLKIHLYFTVEDGEPYYQVYHRNELVVEWSALGFVFEGNDTLKYNLSIEDTETGTYSERWKPAWGQFSHYKNQYNFFKVILKEDNGSERKFGIEFRAFNDGIAFRYNFTESGFPDSVKILSELTEFDLPVKGTAWWIPSDFESYEHLYRTTPINELDAAGTPATFKLEDGTYLSIHEANLTNYAGMTVKNTQGNNLTCNLVPWPDGIKVKTKAPFNTPWRTIHIVDHPGRLIESGLILNLNEPCAIEDISWIEPMKYIGIWWGMHLGIQTWHKGPRHGATTSRTKEYIDFAAENNIGGVLVEGWNTGWDSWFKGDMFDFVTPYDDFDLFVLALYAKEKGVDLIGHHETGGQVPVYEKYIDSAFYLYNKLGIKAVKTGYAGMIRPEGQHHHGQWMVNHYRMVVEKAARYGIMIDAHEPVKPTGISRTYPNMMTREGVRGMEWNAWSDGNPPEHTTILPFTRMLGGPLDYTPGIFDIKCERYAAERKKWDENHSDITRVYTTIAKQLALYVVLYSPMQMAADLIENYEENPAFEFIKKVPVSWDETRVINAEIGNFITIARKNGNIWYLGAITDENSRDQIIEFDFLEPGEVYDMEIYEDGKDADWKENPGIINIRTIKISHDKKLQIRLAKGGGFAAIIKPVK